MKLVVTGANGQVGWELTRRAAGHQVAALDLAELDITDARAVHDALVKHDAEAVINAAAYTAVDKAEQEPELAFAVNRDGPANLASSCADLGIPLLHISTDYVFDGNQTAPYREDDPVAPLGVYGLSKWAGEEAVRLTLPKHIVLRVSWVFGVHGHNFVKTILRLAGEREELRVVADQRGCPTFAGDIAEVLLALVDRSGDAPWGTYHYCGTPATTWHGFAQAIVKSACIRGPIRAKNIIPITTAEYPTPAKRPVNSVLDCSRLHKSFGIAPGPWETGLEALLDNWHFS
jgi:dTDP-4-dehydrorhamnose reductase